MVFYWYCQSAGWVYSPTADQYLRNKEKRVAETFETFFSGNPVTLPQGGPLYLQLKRWIEDAIKSGAIKPGDALPSERDLALRVEVSRVTVRKAVLQLVQEGLLVQRHGSGTFVAPPAQRVEQSLSQLTSFTEDMARRGMEVHAEWLDRGLYAPSPEETIILGLSPGEQVARIARLRLSGETPLAIERASLSSDILPDPAAIGDSLYKHLDRSGNRPVRAIQRIRAANLDENDARLLHVPTGSAGLNIERTSYLASGRVIEFTRSIYRGDTYDFVAELRLGEAPANGTAR
jgi:GntR family transcriptional regulator